ncbi:MAG: hypothetical protein MJ059_03000 [Lachnospiraceae bacterium]|nr:hypothetical protein [Lachnospiraceae bacterium]
MIKRIKCSITVEASLVMVTVLTTVAMLLVTSMSLYDKVLSRCVLIETMELKSHMSEEADYINNGLRLKNCMLSSDGNVMIEEEAVTKTMKGNVNAGGYYFEQTRVCIRPENLMRAVTLTKIFEAESK